MLSVAPLAQLGRDPSLSLDMLLGNYSTMAQGDILFNTLLESKRDGSSPFLFMSLLCRDL